MTNNNVLDLTLPEKKGLLATVLNYLPKGVQEKAKEGLVIRGLFTRDRQIVLYRPS